MDTTLEAGPFRRVDSCKWNTERSPSADGDADNRKDKMFNTQGVSLKRRAGDDLQGDSDAPEVSKRGRFDKVDLLTSSNPVQSLNILRLCNLVRPASEHYSNLRHEFDCAYECFAPATSCACLTGVLFTVARGALFTFCCLGRFTGGLCLIVADRPFSRSTRLQAYFASCLQRLLMKD